MNRVKRIRYRIIVMLFAGMLLYIGIMILIQQIKWRALTDTYMENEAFRRQEVDSSMQSYIDTKEAPGMSLGLYWLNHRLGPGKRRHSYQESDFQSLYAVWKYHPLWNEYIKSCMSSWDSLKEFPVLSMNQNKDPEWNYSNTWGEERTYGGKRFHEGCDIIPVKQQAGYYPVVSMTDGKVTKKGWLNQGGYRIGITTRDSVYFYYAHLSQYGIYQLGDQVKAGDILGYMGDTGYSEIPGTRGQFPVHLHVGVYLCDGTREISINPYYMLGYLERKAKHNRVSASYIITKPEGRSRQDVK